MPDVHRQIAGQLGQKEGGYPILMTVTYRVPILQNVRVP